MALTFHLTVDQAATFTTDSPATVKSKLNSNSDIFENNAQQIENRLENTLDDLCSQVILTGMVPTLNAGSLNLSVSAGRALIGVGVTWAGGSVLCLASQSGASLYFCQDGTWSTTLPTTKSYMIYGTYDSDGSQVTAFYISANILVAPSRLRLSHTQKITAALTDGYAGGLDLDVGYSADSALAVTRHNYINMQNPSLATATISDACALRFDAAAGTHKSIDSGTTKTTPGTVDAWLKLNINGTIFYTPCYTSKTT